MFLSLFKSFYGKRCDGTQEMIQTSMECQAPTQVIPIHWSKYTTFIIELEKHFLYTILLLGNQIAIAKKYPFFSTVHQITQLDIVVKIQFVILFHRNGYGTTGTKVTGPVHVGDPITLLILMRSQWGKPTNFTFTP